MTIIECYEKMGGDYEDVISRLRKEDFVKKFIKKFPDDPSYNELVENMEKEDVEVSFRAAHTLKGVCQNLGLERLFISSNDVTEALRGGDMNTAKELLPKVIEDYKVTIDVVNEFIENEE